MNLVLRSSAFVAFALSLAVAGCGKSKVDQCNSFVEVGNESQRAFVALSAAMLNPDSLKPRVEQIDASVAKLDALKLTDAKLVEIKTSYADGLRGFSKGLKRVVELGKKGPPAELEKIGTELEALSEKESKLIDQVNSYCSAN